MEAEIRNSTRRMKMRFQNLVDRAGFEPAASALRTRRSYRTDLPALFWKNTAVRAFRAFGGSAAELFGHIWILIEVLCKNDRGVGRIGDFPRH